MNPFFPHGNRVLQSPMHALAAEQSDAEAEERAGLRPWRMGAVGCMAAKAPGRARRKGSNGRDGLASCMATTRRKRKPHGQRRVAQCESFNCSCGKQSRSDVIRSCFHINDGGCADVTWPHAGRPPEIGPDGLIELTVRKRCDIQTVTRHRALETMTKSPLKLVPPAIVKRTVTAPGRKPNAVYRTREHLTGAEVDRLIDAAKANRWGHRDATMILVAFRHGLRSSELVDLRWDQSISPMPSCTFAGPRKARLAPIPSVAMKCGPCASCSGSRIPSRRSCSPASGARRSLRRLCSHGGARWRRGQARLSRLTPTCCDTPAGSRWLTKATIPGPFRPTWATETSSTRCDTPSCRRAGSRTSGKVKQG